MRLGYVEITFKLVTKFIFKFKLYQNIYLKQKRRGHQSTKYQIVLF
ncbi:hypothetical protein STA3757_21840 [Stanieria sp. NIES-3757]|nr:hypothetical protein STA3757_21840 [Stanieria sp. NIES-3757]